MQKDRQIAQANKVPAPTEKTETKMILPMKKRKEKKKYVKQRGVRNERNLVRLAQKSKKSTGNQRKSNGNQ